MDLTRATVIQGNFKKQASFLKLLFELENIQSAGEAEIISKNGPAIYFFLHQGTATFSGRHSEHKISTGMYGCLNGSWEIKLSSNSRLLLITTSNLNVLNTLGGPVEEQGRLKYIDGCTDTLLLSPARIGEPCLNLLHFPPAIAQTHHHHPSFRFGVVYSGRGRCITNDGVTELLPGDVFFLPAMLGHHFETFDSVLNVIAFHPDTDWGPTDEVHPMINRTIINNSSR